MDQQFISNCEVYDLKHLAIISCTGEDSAKFLQGQLTCDIYGLNDGCGSFAAFCNAKGRVISSLFVIKSPTGFLIVLPASLLEKVINKLKIYVLRSAVNLTSENHQLEVFGLHYDSAAVVKSFHAEAEAILVKLPWSASRFLFLTTQEQTESLPVLADSVRLNQSEVWRFLEISAGIPWFEADQSELYIPQMLNIDELGGVSFTKGCYTGQEIIARTHYLGKAKRQLFLAEYLGDCSNAVSGMGVLSAEQQLALGSVICVATYRQVTRLLVILQIENAGTTQLVLDDGYATVIKIVNIQK